MVIMICIVLFLIGIYVARIAIIKTEKNGKVNYSSNMKRNNKYKSSSNSAKIHHLYMLDNHYSSDRNNNSESASNSSCDSYSDSGSSYSDCSSFGD